jgi:hypothetical protein
MPSPREPGPGAAQPTESAKDSGHTMRGIAIANLILFALSIASVGCSTPAPGPAFFVAPPPLGDDSNTGTDAAPFATLDRARRAVRAINGSMSSDINVYLHGGKYELAQTISFDQNDSGTNGFHVIYRNYPGEVPVISGGRRIVDWTRTTNRIFKASAQNLQFRQLYVNGVAAERARSPGSDSYYRLQSWDASSRTLVIEKDKISDWANLNQVEMHVLMSWTVNVFRIASYSISGDYAIIVPMEPERTLMFPNDSVSRHLQRPNEPYYFENAMEFLISPGQFYLNSNTNEVFYMPRPGEDMTSAEIIAPSVETLISIHGTLDNPVRNLRFYGVTFAHSGWIAPNSQGLFSNFNSYQSSGAPVSAIYMNAADSIRFERNNFHHIGGSALGLDWATHDTEVIGNVFSGISSNAINIGVTLNDNTTEVTLNDNTTNTRLKINGNIIRNNFLTKVGTQYEASVGINLGASTGTVIEHNEISYVTYSGISEYSSDLENTLIRYNNIHHVMTLLDDGGGIYTVSNLTGNFISENYVHDIVGSPWRVFSSWVSGIYLDEASTLITVSNNVVENDDIGLSLHRAFDNTMVNYIYDVRENVSRNTFLSDDTFDPSAVKANAGIESDYQDILSGGPAP